MQARTLLGSMYVFLAVASCSDSPTSPAVVQGLDQHLLNRGISRIEAGDYGAVQSLLVYRNDELVVEEYFRGTTRSTRSSVQSVTKSVVSALLGMALAEGGLPDGIDTPVLELFPEYGTVENPSALKDAMSVEDLLTMRSGLGWDEWTLLYGHPLNSHDQMLAAPDWSKYVLDRPMVSAPGTHFVYNTGISLLLSGVIERAVGLTAAEYAGIGLFDQLDIDSWLWPSSPEGHSVGGTDLRLTPLGMAKIGLLFLHDGEWDGEQLIPASWIAQSTAAHVGYDQGVEDFEYGYQWWRFRDDLTVAAVLETNDAYFAWGNGGQFIIVVPHLQMVVVMTGANYTGTAVNAVVQIELLRDYILSAVVD